jgi:hypothetical protein
MAHLATTLAVHAAALEPVADEPAAPAPDAAARSAAAAVTPIDIEAANGVLDLPAPPRRQTSDARPSAVPRRRTSQPRPSAEPRLVPEPRKPRRGRVLVALGAAVILGGVGVGAFAMLSGDECATVRRSVAPTGEPTVVATIDRATVPNLLGRRVNAAADLLEQAGLEMGQVRTEPGRAGIVVRTDPTPGEAVVAGTAVDVFIGNGSDG